MDRVSTWERLRRVDRRIWDGLLAVALVGAGAAEVLLGTAPEGALPQPFTLVLTVVGAGAIAWRRRAPRAVALVTGAAATVLGIPGFPGTVSLPLAIALYTVAAERERTQALTVAAPVGLAAVVAPYATADFNWAEALLSFLLTAGIPIGLGRGTYARRARIRRDRELAAQTAVAEERVRIARELHDVVAHSMSVMVVQAGAARAVASRDPAALDEALGNVEAAGRAGLAEMRRLLGVLRQDGEEPALSPQPGLANLDDLLARTRAAGLPVEAIIEGTPRPLPAGVDLSAFRIVQESLTNALRHAGDAHARVLLRYLDDVVEIEVADDGLGPVTGDDGRGHHGLAGMRERAGLCGGTVVAGPREGGGFVVRALLPTGEHA
jgi:signal transduction histidine kinase